MTNGIPLDFFLVCFLCQSSENVTYFFEPSHLVNLLSGTMIPYPQDVFQN